MTDLIKLSFIIVASTLLLASCGGGGGGGGTNTATVSPTPSPGDDGNEGDNGNNNRNVLSSTHNVRNLEKLNKIATGMNTGRGIAVYRVFEIATENQNNIVFLGENIDSFTGGHVDVSSVIFDQSSGMARVGAESFTVLDAYTDDSREDFGLLLSDARGELVVVVSTAPYSNLPTGNFRYEGRNVTISNSADFGQSDRAKYTGTFTLEVDFATRTGSIVASTTEGQTTNVRTFTGSIVVDTTNGTFSGNELSYSLTGTSTETLDPVTIGGIFNGDQASGVSGVYYTLDNAGNSNYSGYILGEQTGIIEPPPMPVIHTLRVLNSPDNADYGIAIYSGGLKSSASTDFVDGKTLLYLGGNIDSFSGGRVDISNANADTGSVRIGTDTYNIIASRTSGNSFGLSAVITDNETITIIGGDPFVPFASIPSGTVTYHGENVSINEVINDNRRDVFTGTFDMEVNFLNNSGTIDMNSDDGGSQLGGVTVTRSKAVSGNLTIDVQNGTFMGINLASSNSFEQTGEEPFISPSSPVQVYGTFHSEDSIGVSGIYFVGVDSLLEYGYIVGAKVP